MKKIIMIVLSVFCVSSLLLSSVSAAEKSYYLDGSLKVSSLNDCDEVQNYSDDYVRQSETVLDAVEDGVPYTLIHCQVGTKVGRYVETLMSTEYVGKETRNCTHGMIGVADERDIYVSNYRQYCTLCNYSTVRTERTYGPWVCKP